MMKTLFCTLLSLFFLIPAAPSMAQAGCADGTTGSDNLTCDVTPPAAGNEDNQFDGDLGNDVLVQSAGVVTVNIDGDGAVSDDLRGLGDGGDDTITNYGTVTASIGGDWVSGNGGDDTIFNYGQVNVNIMGDEALGKGGNDTITNAGTVGNAIHGEDGDDTIILTDGANGGEDHILMLNGGAGTDVLVFSFSDPAIHQQIEDALVGQTPASGSITVGNQTYSWTDFEDVRNEAASASSNRIKTSAVTRWSKVLIQV